MAELPRYDSGQDGQQPGWWEAGDEAMTSASASVAMFDKGESCWKLGGIDQRTLDRWVTRAGMTYQDDPADARRKLLSETQLRHLARRKRRELRPGVPPARATRQQQRARIPSRIEGLEREVAAIREELAAVRAEHAVLMPQMAELVAFIRQPREHRDRGRRPPTPTGEGEDAPVARQEGRETGDESAAAYRPAPRRAVATRPLGAQERLNAPPLPEGWMSVSSWTEAHGLRDHARSVTRAIHKTVDPRLRMPQSTPGPFVGPTGQLLREAYDWPEQHLAAARKAREKWPLHFRPCPLCEDLL